MLIDLGVACAWIAMSLAGAACLILLSRLDGTGSAARAELTVEPAHEDIYSLVPSTAPCESSL